jgi:hypothetical protein
MCRGKSLKPSGRTRTVRRQHFVSSAQAIHRQNEPMRKKLFWAAGVLAAVGIVVGLLLFEPWKALTSSELHEESPLSEQTPAGQTTGEQADAAGADAEGAGAEGANAEPAKAKQLAEGKFVSQEHETTGVAKLIQRADGRTVVRIEKLASSDGPDLYIWLTDRKAGLADWAAYDDGRYVSLGDLKATHGDQNYLVPKGVKLDGLRSVVIWCDRFNVAFGSAELQR